GRLGCDTHTLSIKSVTSPYLEGSNAHARASATYQRRAALPRGDTDLGRGAGPDQSVLEPRTDWHPQPRPARPALPRWVPHQRSVAPAPKGPGPRRRDRDRATRQRREAPDDRPRPGRLRRR